MRLAFVKSLIYPALVFVVAAFVYAAGNPAAVVLKAGFPGEDPALITAVESQLKAAGYTVTEFSASQLCDTAQLDARKYQLLVLTDASTQPVHSETTIAAFMHQGGNVIALNTPCWQRFMATIQGKWISRPEFMREFPVGQLDHVITDYASADVKKFNRSTNRVESPTTWDIQAEGPLPASKALHIVISNLDGWDTLTVPIAANPFDGGRTLTVFTAKGDANTKSMSVEWDEKDGSRWIAIVPISTSWKQFVLKPSDFHYWKSNPKRGDKNDCFNPANATSVTVGQAFTHSGTPGRHEYCVGPIGTTMMTDAYKETLTDVSVQAFDTLTPSYKFFASTGVKTVAVRSDQAVLRQAVLPLPTAISSPQPRPQGAGFNKKRSWRFMPLLESRAANGEWRGTPATLYFDTNGDNKNSLLASFSVGDMQWYKTPAVLNVIRQVAERMKNDVFLLDGGANYYTYFDDQNVTLGVRAVALHGGAGHPDLRARVDVVNTQTGEKVKSQEWPLDVSSGNVQTVSSTWKPTVWPQNGYTVTATLIDGGKVIDMVSHRIAVWRPKAVKQFVTIQNGDFMLNGKKWRVHGVNYMPSSGIGTEMGEYFEKWMSAQAYDPEIIQRDLQHIKDIGFNEVSIFLYRDSMEDQNLLDILRRLDSLGIKANLSLRPGTPMDFPWQIVKEMIQYYRLPENDTVFAYDLAWEPNFGPNNGRMQWDREWEQWVVERYGSVANAEKDWGYAIPRTASGVVTNPNSTQFTDNKAVKMVAAYRRFLDTLLYKRYGEARRLVQSIDPNHAVSFRMTEAGNPTNNSTETIPYDFAYLAGAVDVLEPEAYGRGGNWDKVKPGWYQFEYARWADATKPMMWAEMGTSVWDMSTMSDPEERLQYAATFYRDFYRMLNSSAADGIVFWWYPGGFRVNERSDYGIINADGSDRPVTKVIRENAKSFLAGPNTKPINQWIEFDRDAKVSGLYGAYGDTEGKFWSAIDKGMVPGLRTSGTGTTSANCPLIAVGNNPLNGNNPPKYLDGAFDVVEVQNADGQWQAVAKGGSVTVRANQPVKARVLLTNLGEATWVAGKQTGAVVLIAHSTGDVRNDIPAALARFAALKLDNVQLTTVAITAPTTVELSLLADGRTAFGERFTIKLQPK
ncbi:MAG TPA: hypothetical protein VHV83_19225 [Armatimonadota bacterium]|nr:hypothetical protein [Armatimonadota bacterium]